MKRQATLFALLIITADVSAGTTPLLDRITATSPTTQFESTIRGSAGAVEPSALVAVVNQNTGHYSVVRAGADGAFETRLFAPGGSSLLIKSDASGEQLRRVFEGEKILSESAEMVSLPGTIVPVPDPIGSSRSITATGFAAESYPPWVAELTVDKVGYAVGEPITIDGTFVFLGQSAPGETPRLGITLTLLGVSRADGSGTLAQNSFYSTSMTPTELPIERLALNFGGPPGDGAEVPMQAEGDRLRAGFRVQLRNMMLSVPAGLYRPVVIFSMIGVKRETQLPRSITQRIDSAMRSRNGRSNALLPIIRIGNPAPPRMSWTLLADTLSQGTRGLTALEERGRVAVASRIAVSSDRLIVPRTDSRSGTRIAYDLEPFALAIAAGTKGDAPNPPTIPLRFPSGSLTVTVKRPDGGITTIGPAPFRQPRMSSVVATNGFGFMLDSNYLTDAFQLTTLDPRFRVEFEQEGLHEIALRGTIDDIWGYTWTGGGTYLLDVARPLEIDTAVMAGTPLEVGNWFNPSVQLLPAVPGDVEIRFRLAGNSRRASVSDRVLRGTANRYGYARFEPIALPTPGEYRIDIAASYREPDGRMWAGTRTWGTVVAPLQTPIIAHGRRGVDDQQTSRQIWFSRKQIGLSKSTGGHLPFAFQSGDVEWMEENDAVTTVVSFEDPLQVVLPNLKRNCCLQNAPSSPLEEQILNGELPVGFSFGRNNLDPHLLDSSEVEFWAYAYRFVERPRVRVREIIAEEGLSGLYWRFNDHYGLQSGTGPSGDKENDFKFQFAGIAFHGPALPQPVYAIYGSLFILVPDTDPGGGTRVFPPFQGNGGGSSGGPLFKLKGREIEIFFHLTAVCPGTILHVGDTATMAGQIGPTLASKVEIVVTSPSGQQRTVDGQANKVGYFYDPADDFVVHEAGVWKAKVKVWHDGPTSAGQVQPPFPTGDVLGSREGEFYFYVVERDAPTLTMANMPHFVRPAHESVTLNVLRPSGLSNLEMTYTVTMPGFILEEGVTTALQYVYDARRLARDFPNLDLDEHGVSGIDTITFSFLVSGTDASGGRRHFARQIVLQGEELQFGEAGRGKRRAAKR